MQHSLDITTLIFLALAVFVIWRLRSVLGQKTGFERPPERPSERAANDASARSNNPGTVQPESTGNVIRLPGNSSQPVQDQQQDAKERWKPFAEPGTSLHAGFEEIAAKETGFEPQAFLEGAKSAYETILAAFANGDRNTLKNLLNRDVFEGFEKVIAGREARGETVETTLVAIPQATFETIEVQGRVAQVTVRFLTRMITVTLDREGAVIEGSKDSIDDVTDIWTFVRTLGTRDPTWQLSATGSA
jgi:predicted lipid-binding transport protein (Tim44 family)